jgi:hypothetical protein
VAELTRYQGYQQALGLKGDRAAEIVEFEKKFSVRQRLWQVRQQFGEESKQWYRSNFRDQDAQAVAARTDELHRELGKMVMAGGALGRDAQDDVHAAATREVAHVKKHLNLILALGNPAMKEKHWVKVWGLCESPPATLLNFPLQSLVDQGIENHLELVEEISAFAGGEAAILRTIDEIEAKWEETNFTVKDYRDKKGYYYITEIDDLVT